MSVPNPKIVVVCSLIMLAILSCKKEGGPKATPSFNVELLKGGTWVEMKPDNPAFIASMKLRFYGTSNVTFCYLTSAYPSLKYDSMPHGNWELFGKDTVRLYDRRWSNYGDLVVIKLTDSFLYTKMSGYLDTTLFKRK